MTRKQETEDKEIVNDVFWQNKTRVTNRENTGVGNLFYKVER